MVKKIVSTLPDTAMSASVVDKDTDTIAYLRGIEAGTGINIEIVDADDNKFITPEKKIRISTTPGGVFRYMGILHAGQDDLPSNPIQGDFYRIVGFGNFNGATGTLNVGDGISWNGSNWDKQDNTDPTVSGTSNRISVAGTGSTGFIVDIDSSYKGQSSIDTVGTITTGTWNASIVDLEHGGTGADTSSIPNKSILIKNGSTISAIDLPINSDSVLTHTGATNYAWLPRGEINTASNTGNSIPNSATIFAQKVGSDLQFRRLVGGTNVTISNDSNTITISALDTGEINTASNLGSSTPDTADIFGQKSGVDFQFRRLKAGRHVSLSQDASSVTIDSADFDVVVRGITGLPLFHQRVGNTFEFKRVAAGNNITLMADPDTITISATNVGESNTGSNVGAGSQVFLQKSGVDLQFRSIVGSGVINVAQGGQELTITSTAEANTGSNLGSTGARVYAQKTGADLQFRRILQGQGIIVQENPDDITINAIPQKRLQDANNNTFIEVDQDGMGSLDTIEMRVGGQKAIEMMPGNINITGNTAANGTNDIGASVSISAGRSDGVANGGVLTISGGRGGSLNGNGGIVNIASGDGGGGNANGGDIHLTLSRPTGSGVYGSVIIRNNNNERALEIANAGTSYLKITGTKIAGFGSIEDIEFTPNGGKVKLSGLAYPSTDGTIGQILATDGAGNLHWTNDVGEVITGKNIGSATPNSATIYSNKINGELQFRRVVGGTNVNVVETSDSVVISSIDTGEANIGANIGTGSELYKDKTNSVLLFRKINGTGLISITQNTDDITIMTTAEANTVSQRGIVGQGVVELFAQKTNSDFEFRRMQAGTNMLLQQDTNYVTFSTLAEINEAENIGTGTGIFANSKNGAKLQFHSLMAGSNIALSTINGAIVITATDVGEVNDGSNIGTPVINDAEIFAGKNGRIFNFRRLVGSSQIQLTENNDNIVIETSAASISYVDTGLSSKANTADLHTVATSGNYNSLINLPSLGTASTRDVGSSAGQIPVLDSNGKLVESILPALAITDVYAVTNIAARDALVAQNKVQSGDVAIVTENSLSYIYNGTEWKELHSAGYVTSVAGKTGNVALNLDDLTDVAIVAPTVGHVIRHDGNTFINTKLSYSDLLNLPFIATTLDGLADVAVNVPSIGQVLRHDGTQFVNTKLTYTDLINLPFIPVSFDDLSDVQISLPNDGETVRYDSATHRFVNTKLHYNDLNGAPSLSGVATSGNINDTSGSLPVNRVSGLGDLSTKNEVDLNLKALAHKDTIDYSEVLNKPVVGTTAGTIASGDHTHTSFASVDHTHTSFNSLTLNGITTISGNYAESFENIGAVAIAHAVDTTKTSSLIVLPSGDTTITLNAPGVVGSIVSISIWIQQSSSGNGTITWPTSVKWSDGLKPSLTTAGNAVDLIMMSTWDNGVTWYGSMAGANFS